MIARWQIDDLIALVRQQYPDWDSFDHPPFVEDEISPKQASATKAQELLNPEEVDRLLAAGEYGEMIARLERLGRDNNLLWRAVPRRGDLAILYDERLDPGEFCYVMRKLLYGPEGVAERLEGFSEYVSRMGLPNRWPFPTYFLFLIYPEREMFVKPSVARWFLQFLGQADAYRQRPNSATYSVIRRGAQALMDYLQGYGPGDMIDIQSFIWVAMRQSQDRVGGLDSRGQVELDVPGEAADGALETTTVADMALREVGAAYEPGPVAPYPIEELAAATGFAAEEVAGWVRAIERKGQVIFYGPPGTGKTFAAQQLARHLTGGGDGFVELLQFHPAYSYEEFMQGIRPRALPDGRLSYEWVDGRFLDFCRRAAERRDRCVLIIDEINRANLARVFGELMYLLEYREQSVALASGRLFHIPENVRLIGTMNTADRSIALVDHALRRRFAFIVLPPNYELLRRYHEETGFPVEGMITVLQRLNQAIGDPHYHLGVSFFLQPDLAANIADIWRMEIEPYLEEYFFDRAERVGEFRWERVREEIEGRG